LIKVKSPTRIDLAGGTLDMWPLSAFLGTSHTINLAINIFTEVTLEPHPDGHQIILRSLDLSRSKIFSNLAELAADSDQTWSLLKEVILFFKPQKGFTLTAQSGSPVGGGLGGSSSLVCSLLKAFSTWLHAHPSFLVHDWVELAHNLEARVLMTPTGTQDYYPALIGGLNCITYSDSGISLRTYDLSSFQFSSSYLLVDTGRSHHSGLNNFDVLTRAVKREKQVLSALTKIQGVSQDLYDWIQQSPESVPWLDIFDREYSARVELSPTFTSPEIEGLRQIVTDLRPRANFGIKILGAGGGGCILVWGKSEQDKSLAQEVIQSRGFRVLPVEFVDVL